jgi:hypothetical protein
MSEEQRRDELLGTTDCLEAISIFKSWKNFLFVLAVICLVLLQICFWLIDAEVIRSEDANAPQQTVASIVPTPVAAIVELAAKTEVEVPQDVVAKAAAQSITDAKNNTDTPESSNIDTNPQSAEPNQAAPAGKMEIGKVLHIKFEHIAWLIRICNYLLIFVITLYCLTLLFCLKISLLGRLGGLNHISRAFLLSLVVFVLVLPWQKFFGGIAAGLIYTPSELLDVHTKIPGSKIINIALYYLRFCGLWVVVMAVLVFSQVRSIRWAKATMRRLGVM